VTHTADTGNSDTLRTARLNLRAWLWDAPRPDRSAVPRVASCGRKRVAGYVTVKAGAGASSLGGLATCGSVWVCPVCSPKVAATRSVEVQDTVRAWQARGGSVLLVTLTLSHGRRHALADTWDALGNGWASVRNGNPWKADAARFGIAGYLRVIEVTHSARNGWHPHAHVLLFVTGTPTDAECEELRERIFGRWSRRLARDGFKTLDFDRNGKAVGVDVRRADAHTLDYLAEYLAKFGYQPRSAASGLALEVSRGDLKSGRKGSRTPWEIAEAARDGDRASLRLWQEWERVSLGRRQYAWAQGFRESLDLDDVVSDAEAAEREDAAHQPVALLEAPTWRLLVTDLRAAARSGRRGSLMGDLLTAAANLDGPAFRGWLRDTGIPYVAPDDATAHGPATPDHWQPLDLPAPGIRRAHLGTFGNRRDQIHRERVRQDRAGWLAADHRAETQAG
jgi:hypothetical protein